MPTEDLKKYHSLEGVYSTVDATASAGKWKHLLAFLGPAYLISVGYMDPGNWATDIAAGSHFGNRLLWVLLLSNLMAILLQYLCTKLGLVRGRDLAQACREAYPKIVNLILYGLAEIAIAATDLAEVLGMAIGLNLLFGLPILWGVCISILDTFLLLLFQQFGMRKMEAFILSLIGIIGICFFVNLFIAQPMLSDIGRGFIPHLGGSYALYLAIGIIGATVMPHNLYLHSALVQSRKINRSDAGLKEAIKFNLFDSAIALNLAFFVNAAIMILAATAFFGSGHFGVVSLQQAHHLLAPLLGTAAAPILFAIALIAAGQSSTITSTLAGQVVMEGFLQLRIQPWLRRLITRIIAILPAFFVIYFSGADAATQLLVLSQVILSLQLGFATIPLIHFVSDKSTMGKRAIGSLMKTLAWITAAIIVLLNLKLVWAEISSWFHRVNMLSLQIPIAIIALAAVVLLIYITLFPWINKKQAAPSRLSATPHGEYAETLEELSEPKPQTSVMISVDFSEKDREAISHALRQGGKHAEYHLVHVVETAGAHIFGGETSDYESAQDQRKLDEYVQDLTKRGFRAEGSLGFGNPKKVITNLANDLQPGLLVMGAHGHKRFKDIIFGQTVVYVRHHVDMPVLVV